MNVLEAWVARLGRPLVVAHRGASRAAPENSLSALRRAADEGADGVEFDVQRCGSGELVVFHDRTLARCTGVVGTVAETPLEALRALTLDRLDRFDAGEGIPTLAEWLAEAPAGLLLNLEVKVDTLADADVATACVLALQATRRGASCLVSSFHPAALGFAAAADPHIARGALVDGASGWAARLALGLLTRPAAVHPEHVLVTPQRVSAWKRLGLKVATWTVDDPDEARRCLEAGVDAVITNRPDLVRPVAERFGR